MILLDKKTVRKSKEKYVSIDNAMTEAEHAEKLNISSHEMEQMKDAIINTMHNLSAIVRRKFSFYRRNIRFYARASGIDG
ncbi:hypothetical protein KHA80_05940 [Anaerobacillus sp. HL2]|nr:hypothetical protein KHA80_05940 [Anaerobacillus sp. HL2]